MVSNRPHLQCRQHEVALNWEGAIAVKENLIV